MLPYLLRTFRTAAISSSIASGPNRFRRSIATARIVKLNVGGTRYETSISTVMKHPNSMLGAMIQKSREQKMIESGEEIFIDRNGKMFEYVLEYLRNGDLSVMPDGDLAILEQLKLEAEFFEMNGLKSMIEKKLQLLTNDGWKVGDIVTEDDLTDGSFFLNRIGTIVQFRTDGKVAVRFEHFNDHSIALTLVNLKSKQA